MVLSVIKRLLVLGMLVVGLTVSPSSPWVGVALAQTEPPVSKTSPEAVSKASSASIHTFSLGTVWTEAEAAVVNAAVQYAQGLTGTEILDISKTVKPGDRFSHFKIRSPEAKIETGDNDTFNAVIVKILSTGYYVHLKELVDPETGESAVKSDASKLFHVIPVGFGFEADRRFDNISAIAEIGYLPYRLSKDLSTTKLGVNPQVGIALQAGYKFKVNTPPGDEAPTGGAVDESEESPDSALLRLKAQMRMQFPNMFGFVKLGKDLTLTPILDAAAWYDIKNTATYHELRLTLRLPLAQERFFDLVWQDGSGAPNFNQGDQFGANLTVSF